MIKQVQAFQKKLNQAQSELEGETAEGSSGGGAVRVVVTGGLRLQSIEIAPGVAGEDVEMLQDLVAAAVNDGLENAQEMAASRMMGITGGLNIPGLT